MPNYAPIVAPGDQRRRTRFISIRTPLGQVPQVEVLEQEVILTAAGERVLEDLGALPVGPFDPAESFPLRDPETDALLGQTGTVGQTHAMIYSWVRAKQLARDLAEAEQAARLASQGAPNA